MHMPGHKRNTRLLAMENPYGLDVTEVEGLDDLHHPQSVLAAAMERAAALYHSDRSFYLVNGSTGGLLAAICAATRQGDRILAARNCHKAVYHAIGLRGLRPVYMLPEAEISFGMTGSVAPGTVAEALDRYDDISLVVLTSPTYEGVVSDIAAIASLCHRQGIPLLVDGAHGAHLGLSPAFPENALSCGADLVVHSLHKTLPAFTQASLLHLQGPLVSEEEIRRQLAVFQTSSPSYLLMASLDRCVSLLASRAGDLFAAYEERLRRFYAAAEQWRNIALFRPDGQRDAVFGFDRGKLLFSASKAGCSGVWLAAMLRRTYQIETEMAMGNYVLAMTSICDSDEGFSRLADALAALDQTLPDRGELPLAPALPPLPPAVFTIGEAESRPGIFAPLQDAVGGVCREYVYAYPPGIPLVAPGEVFTPAITGFLAAMEKSGVALKSTYGRLSAAIQLVAGIDSRNKV